MKTYSTFCFIFLGAIMLSACQSESTQVVQKTTTPTIETTLTVTPTITPTITPSITPTPTITNTPSQTPVPPTPTYLPPEIVLESLANVEVILIDNIDSYSGWRNRLGVITNGTLEIEGQGNWVQIERAERLTLGEAIIVQFKFTEGANIEIYIGNGDWGTDSYRRFGLYVFPDYFVTNIWQGEVMISTRALRNIQPTPDTWYSMLIAVNNNREFITTIWETNDSSDLGSYYEQFDETWNHDSWAVGMSVSEGLATIDRLGVVSFSEFDFSPRQMTFVPDATPIVWANTEISLENASQVENLETWGRGISKIQMYVDDGNKVIVQTLFGIYIYDAVTFEMIDFLPDVNKFVLSPDTKTLAVAYANGMLEMWDMSTVSLLESILHYPAEVGITRTDDEPFGVQAIAFSFDGELCAVSFGDKVIELYQMGDFELLQTLYSPLASIPASLIFSPDSRYLLSDDQNVVYDYIPYYFNRVSIWQIENGELLNTIYDAGKISDYAINPDGTRLITTKWGGYILVYELPSGRLLSTYGTGLPFPLAHFSIDGQHILVNYGSQVRNITNGLQEEIENVDEIMPNRIQDYVSLPNARLWALQHIGGLQELRVGSNNSLVAWGRIDQTIFRWETPQQSFTPYILDTRRVGNMVISHNEDIIATCISNELLVTNVDSGESSNWGDCQGRVIAFSPDDQLLLRNDRMVDFLAFPDGELSANIRDYDLVASTTSGNHLLTISQNDGRFVIWTADLAIRYPLADDIPETVTSFVVSPDETMAVSADDRVRFWRLSDGWQTKIITIEARSLAFTPDGSMLAVGGQDGSIHLLHMPSGDEIVVLNGHKDMVVDLEFTSDGANLISLSADGTIRLWGIEP